VITLAIRKVTHSGEDKVMQLKLVPQYV